MIARLMHRTALRFMSPIDADVARHIALMLLGAQSRLLCLLEAQAELSYLDFKRRIEVTIWSSFPSSPVAVMRSFCQYARSRAVLVEVVKYFASDSRSVWSGDSVQQGEG